MKFHLTFLKSKSTLLSHRITNNYTLIYIKKYSRYQKKCVEIFNFFFLFSFEFFILKSILRSILILNSLLNLLNIIEMIISTFCWKKKNCDWNLMKWKIMFLKFLFNQSRKCFIIPLFKKKMFSNFTNLRMMFIILFLSIICLCCFIKVP